jgi:hypothetical protein
MSNRFWISGVEIGMLKAFAKMEDEEGINKLLDEIEDKQFIGDAKEFDKIYKKIIIKNK